MRPVSLFLFKHSLQHKPRRATDQKKHKHELALSTPAPPSADTKCSEMIVVHRADTLVHKP